MTKYVQSLDPSRLYNPASGWVDANVGDLIDMHKYVGPGALYPTSTRASVLGEFGGLGLKVDQHQWIPEDSFSYEMQVSDDAVVVLTVGCIESMQSHALQGVAVAASHVWLHAPIARHCSRPCACINPGNVETWSAVLSCYGLHLAAYALHKQYTGRWRMIQCCTE